MRKLAILVPVFAVLAFAQLASAQQGDIMIGGGTLLSSSPASGLGNFQQPAEKGGTYINITGDVIGFKHRIGFGVETAWRASQANYPDYQDETYRPILTDFNAVFQPKITKKIGADLFGGIGVASTRFYVPQIVSCSYVGCINYSSSDHFMEDLGGGIRYYVWNHFFVRPEIHYYHIQNNEEFNSNNVFRVGGSIGYTIGND
ncbi:MAG: outer membrane beta-barrel protein [Candidatus Sulfotelmatobacter sp.]